MTQSTDRIERQILIKATRDRVWKALSNAEEFGKWFGVNLSGKSFAAGQRVQGQIRIPGYEYITFDIHIEQMDPQRSLVWRWHPAPVERGVDYSDEPTTRVEFTLADADANGERGTLVKVVETGFDQLSADRRQSAFRMNSGGWDGQSKNLRNHVEAT